MPSHRRARARALAFAVLLLASAAAAFARPDAEAARTRELEVICTLAAEHTSRLGPEVSGRVVEVAVEVGDRVRRGQPLVRLDPALFEAALAHAKAAQAVAEAQAEEALSDYARIDTLWRQPSGPAPSVTPQQRDRAKARLEVARARLQQAAAAVRQAAVRLERTVVRAPYDGVVTARWVAVGDVVNAAPVTRLLEVQSRDPIVAEFSLPQRWLTALRAAAGDPQAHPVRLDFDGAPSLEAPIERLWPRLDPATRSVRVRLLLPNPHGLYVPGMLGRARIRLGVTAP